MVSLWGASSTIKSIQRGVISITAAASNNTASITAVDLDNCRLTRIGSSSNNGAQNDPASSVLVILTNSTTITGVRSGTGSADTSVAWQIVEYLPGIIKSVQRTTVTYSSATSAAVTITSVDTNKSLIDDLGCRVGNTLDSLYNWWVFTNATTVTANRFGAGGDSTVASLQVVEFF